MSDLSYWQERAYRAEDLVEKASGTIGELRAELDDAKTEYEGAYVDKLKELHAARIQLAAAERRLEEARKAWVVLRPFNLAPMQWADTKREHAANHLERALAEPEEKSL